MRCTVTAQGADTMNEVLETLVHIGTGAELEARYVIDEYGIKLLQVQINGSWQDAALILQTEVILEIEAEIAEIERELAELA